ncbi:polysaccharide deacetylase family protein [Actinomadura welshii]
MLLVAGCEGGEEKQARTAGERAALEGRPEPQSHAPPSPPAEPPPARKIDCLRVRCVALTFDDGPGPHTARLLDTLKKGGVRATFFLLGKSVREHPEVVRRMVLDGHEVANHTWSHPDLTGLPPAGVKSEIERTQKAVKEASGVEPALMRPPYGATDEGVRRAVGLPQILWSVDTKDWRYRSADRGARIGINKPVGGDIVLYHDTHKSTVDCIPEVVDGLSDRGFTFVTVSELFRGERLQPGESYTDRAVEKTPAVREPRPGQESGAVSTPPPSSGAPAAP